MSNNVSHDVGGGFKEHLEFSTNFTQLHNSMWASSNWWLKHKEQKLFYFSNQYLQKSIQLTFPQSYTTTKKNVSNKHYYELTKLGYQESYSIMDYPIWRQLSPSSQQGNKVAVVDIYLHSPPRRRRRRRRQDPSSWHCIFFSGPTWKSRCVPHLLDDDDTLQICTETSFQTSTRMNSIQTDEF